MDSQRVRGWAKTPGTPSRCSMFLMLRVCEDYWLSKNNWNWLIAALMKECLQGALTLNHFKSLMLVLSQNHEAQELIET